MKNGKWKMENEEWKMKKFFIHHSSFPKISSFSGT